MVCQTVGSERSHPEIFEQSIVYVDEDDNWGHWDCRSPKNRVELEYVRPSRISAQSTYGILNGPRIVVRRCCVLIKQILLRSIAKQSSFLDKFPEFRDGIEGNKAFRDFLQVVPSTPASSGISLPELKCYDDIFHKIIKGVNSFQGKRFDSNQMHTWFFASMMLQHPFFLDGHPSLKDIEMAV